MKTAIVKTAIWKDDKIYRLNIDTKILYLFLSSSPDRNTTRFYVCNDRLISAYVGISDKALELCKSQLTELGLVFFFNGWVILGDDSYVQPYRGKLSQAIHSKDLDEVPLDVKAFAQKQGLKLSTGKSSRAALEYKDINKDNEDENEVWDVNEKGDAVWKRLKIES